MERYVPADAKAVELAKPSLQGFKSLIEAALEISKKETNPQLTL